MEKGMKLFNVNFSPHYPVPSGLIIAATSEDQARDIAWETLEDEGLAHKNSMESLEIQEIKVEEPGVIFFESGMY